MWQHCFCGLAICDLFPGKYNVLLNCEHKAILSPFDSTRQNVSTDAIKSHKEK